jgi:glucose-1-phosphate thymidylyltransferase
MIRKGIVLAAGKGTRLAPLTLAIPKEMIRIGVKPVVEHAIEVLRAGGVKDLLVIVGRRKEAIIDYLGSGERLGVDISYKIQEEPAGTANAVSLGKSFTGDEDFAVIYGDNYLKPPEVMKDVVEFHREKVADATLVLHPTKDPTRFGVVKVDTKNVVLGMLEKPTLEEAEPYKVADAYLNIAGLLILKPAIFDFIERTEPGREGEVWLTDSVDLMRRNGRRVLGFMFDGTRYDVGTFESLMEADRLEQLRR